MIAVLMPRLSDSMQQGTILTWLKADGEQVQTGDELLEIETEKATMTHAAEASGTLQILADEGESLPVGALIAHLRDTTNRDAPERHPTPAASGPSPSDESRGAVGAASADPLPARTVADGRSPHTTGASATDENSLSLMTAEPTPSHGGTPAVAVKATPLARRIAAEHGLSLLDVPGSGPHGRITRSDVLARAGLVLVPPRTDADGHAASTSAAALKTPAIVPLSTSSAATTVELSRLQTVVARRMAEAKATIPHFQVQAEVAMDAVLTFREQLKRTVTSAPSLNDFIVKATAIALRDHPLANGSFRDGRFELHEHVNVGIAVAAENALVVPTIFDADRKSLGAIAAETRRLASRVRDQTITPPELSGATFTISNLRMYGMTAITPVINPPQAAILGVGAARGVVHRVNGKLLDRQLLTLTLSCDHRILYGADAARFLSLVRKLLEHPLHLVL